LSFGELTFVEEFTIEKELTTEGMSEGGTGWGPGGIQQGEG
jgi:hypothetical protein